MPHLSRTLSLPERSGVPDLTAIASPLKQALIRGCACRPPPRDTRHNGAWVDYILAELHNKNMIFIVAVDRLRQVLRESTGSNNQTLPALTCIRAGLAGKWLFYRQW